MGTTPEWFALLRRDMIAGRALAPDDQRNRRNVVVLTEFGARRLLATQAGFGPTLRNLGALIGGQLLYVTPFVLFGAVLVAVDLARTHRQDGAVGRLLFWATFLLQVHRAAVRCACTGRIYGWRFATLVPVRTLWANWINFFATVGALRRYVAARLASRPLVWLKTEHMYPTLAALTAFQKQQGFEASGLPDQRTLWALIGPAN